MPASGSRTTDRHSDHLKATAACLGERPGVLVQDVAGADLRSAQSAELRYDPGARRHPHATVASPDVPALQSPDSIPAPLPFRRRDMQGDCDA